MSLPRNFNYQYTITFNGKTLTLYLVGFQTDGRPIGNTDKDLALSMSPLELILNRDRVRARYEEPNTLGVTNLLDRTEGVRDHNDYTEAQVIQAQRDIQHEALGGDVELIHQQVIDQVKKLSLLFAITNYLGNEYRQWEGKTRRSWAEDYATLSTWADLLTIDKATGTLINPNPAPPADLENYIVCP